MSDIDANKAIMSYMYWHGPATFLRCLLQEDMKNTDIGLIGVPYSGGNMIERMQYLGPRAVRNRSMAYNRVHREFEINPFELLRIRDLGDAPLPRGLNPDMAAEDLQVFFEKVFSENIIPVSIGGDHSITWPILRAARKIKFSTPIAMIHFDAHTDAAPESFGTKNTAAGFGYGGAEGIIDPSRTVQIGIRGPMGDKQQDDWAKDLGFRIITTNEFVDRGVDEIIKEVRQIIGTGPAYLSFDLDALDPAYAPGVADPEPDGLTLREVRKLILGLRGIDLMGADLVCYCPPLDNPLELTALTICLLMHDVISLIADYKQATHK